MKSDKIYFNMPIGSWCGLLLEKELAVRVQKLLTKQSHELRELIASRIDETEVKNWTLVYPDGEQTSLTYFTPTDAEEKLKRLSLLNKSERIKKEDIVFVADSKEDAKLKYTEYAESIGEIKVMKA